MINRSTTSATPTLLFKATIKSAWWRKSSLTLATQISNVAHSRVCYGTSSERLLPIWVAYNIFQISD
ncbi:MAG: hypothetical protein GZ091_02325 [Paludibacter sp.]|nr:hypothetical protein [Paludibacter sp.]